MTMVKPFLYTDFDYGLLRLPDSDYCLTAGVTGQQGMPIPPWHLITPVVYLGVRVCNAFIFVLFLLDSEINNGSLSLHAFSY